MHILYLVPHIPRPTKARSYFQVRGLLEAGHNVTVATLKQSLKDNDNIRYLEELGVSVAWAFLSRHKAVLNSLSALLSPIPLQAAFAQSKDLERAIAKALQMLPPDIIHIEHLRMANYGLSLTANWPIVWDAVDNLSSLYEQAARTSTNSIWRLISRIEAPRLRSYESYLVSRFAKTLVITQRDKELFKVNAATDANKIAVTPLGLPVPDILPIDRSPNTIVLTGTLNYDPNVASVLYFVQEIFPIIIRKFPNIRLQLVGANPTAAIQALRSPNIEVTGYVPSITDYLCRATLAVAPILYGSGVQIKVLEALATRTPIVATSMALRGLNLSHDEEVLIANTPEEFANAVIALLQDAELRSRLGEAGHRYFEQNHDLRATTAKLVKIYTEVKDNFIR